MQVIANKTTDTENLNKQQTKLMIKMCDKNESLIQGLSCYIISDRDSMFDIFEITNYGTR